MDTLCMKPDATSRALHQCTGSAMTLSVHAVWVKEYLRQHWEHAFITACPAHGCLLIEKCPACYNWLTQSANTLSYPLWP